MINIEVYNGEHILEFDEERHLYFLDGEYIPSVTQIIDGEEKTGLIFWAVDETTKAMERVFKPDTLYSDVHISAMLKYAKKAHMQKSDEAKDIGTVVHNWIEEYTIYSINNDNLRPQILDQEEVEDEDIPPDSMILPQTPEARSSVLAFMDWVETNDVQFLGTEERIVSVKDQWAGTRDTRAIVNGKLGVWDYKTSKNIYGDMFVQGAAYAKGGEEMGEDPVEEVWILRVPKDGGEFEAKCHTQLRVKYSIDQLYEVFLAKRKVWQFNGGSKRRKKKRDVKKKS